MGYLRGDGMTGYLLLLVSFIGQAPSDLTSTALTMTAKVVIYAPAKPCTAEQKEEDQRRRDKSTFPVAFSECTGLSDTLMAEIEGDKVTIFPGYSAEQVILQMADSWIKDVTRTHEENQRQRKRLLAQTDYLLKLVEDARRIIKQQQASQDKLRAVIDDYLTKAGLK